MDEWITADDSVVESDLLHEGVMNGPSGLTTLYALGDDNGDSGMSFVTVIVTVLAASVISTVFAGWVTVDRITSVDTGFVLASAVTVLVVSCVCILVVAAACEPESDVAPEPELPSTATTE